VGERFSAPVQTGPGTHPTSYTTGNASFPGLNWPERGIDQQPPSSAEVEGSVESYTSVPLLGLLQADLYLYLQKQLYR